MESQVGGVGPSWASFAELAHRWHTRSAPARDADLLRPGQRAGAPEQPAAALVPPCSRASVGSSPDGAPARHQNSPEDRVVVPAGSGAAEYRERRETGGEEKAGG